MSCDDYADNENKENTLIDMDNVKNQLLSDQEKKFEEQIKDKINDTEDTDKKLTIDEQELKSKINNVD